MWECYLIESFGIFFWEFQVYGREKEAWEVEKKLSSFVLTHVYEHGQHITSKKKMKKKTHKTKMAASENVLFAR